MKHTEEQAAILQEAERGQGDILINACAGTGKTLILLETLKVIPQKSALILTFNKAIADELTRRLPPRRAGHVVHVKTYHALGRSILGHHFGDLEIDKDATETLVNLACDQIWPKAPYEARSSAVRLIRAVKESLCPPTVDRPGAPSSGDVILGAPTIRELGHRRGLFSSRLTGSLIERTLSVVLAAINQSDVVTRSLDFCDLIWLPLRLNLASPSRYQAILLDELQDTSAPQIALVNKLRLPATRIIGAGDPRQDIYGWRGSLGVEIWQQSTQRSTLGDQAKQFKLTVNWRCAKAIIEEAQPIVPELKPTPDAEEGAVSSCTLGELPIWLAQSHSDGFHTFILSRTNSALVDCALYLWRAGIRFKLNSGKGLLDPVLNLLGALNLRDEEQFRSSLTAWFEREAAKADEIGSTSRREQITEQKAMLLAALRFTKPTGLRTLLTSMLNGSKSGVLLSTVHRVKGLEAERVFLLSETFVKMRTVTVHTSLSVASSSGGLGTSTSSAHEWHYPVGPSPSNDAEELNITYVAITRAKSYLTWVAADRDEPKPGSVKPAKLRSDEIENELAFSERAFQYAESRGKMDMAQAFAKRAEALADELSNRRGMDPREPSDDADDADPIEDDD